MTVVQMSFNNLVCRELFLKQEWVLNFDKYYFQIYFESIETVICFLFFSVLIE